MSFSKKIEKRGIKSLIQVVGILYDKHDFSFEEIAQSLDIDKEEIGILYGMYLEV
ncbi:MAG: hypothetical protein ACTSPI_03570 [Candidatus Heimdallarchaeaceae archaeon]